ncbi:MAG: hypothetical protein FJ096_04920 [Deltaproteobacteria bacterium]|nr:hypothetical protein [Deltaproteobacteria bacterium]
MKTLIPTTVVLSAVLTSAVALADKPAAAAAPATAKGPAASPTPATPVKAPPPAVAAAANPAAPSAAGPRPATPAAPPPKAESTASKAESTASKAESTASKAESPAAATGPKPLVTALVKPGPTLDKAQEPQKKEAAEAMKAGKEAFEKGKNQEALGFFLKSYQAVASPNSRMMLSRALARLGRLSEAYREAKAAAVEANAAAAQNPKYKPTADSLRDDINDMEKRLAFVTVKVTGEPDDAILTVGGKPIDRADWTNPIAVEPGTVKVELATADGKSTESVTTAAGMKVTVPIEMPRAAVAEAPAATAEVKVASSWTGPDRKKIGYIAAGVGGVGMLAFGTFGALSNGQFSRLESGCPSRFQCDPELADVADRGKAYQAVANTSLVIGVLGLATGAGFVVWDALDGGGWPWNSASAVRPRLAVGPGSLTVSGSF